VDHDGDGRNRLKSSPIFPIQTPIAIGAVKTGVDRGAASVETSLRTRLEERGRTWILDRLLDGIVTPVAPLETPDMRRHPGAALELEAVAEASRHLAPAVADSISRGELALVIGGDHSAAIGSIAGAARDCRRLAVIWIDAHADMNWPEVSPSGRIHGMSLAASLGKGPEQLTHLYGDAPKVLPEDVALIGIRLLDPGEDEYLHEHDCQLYTMPDVDEAGVDATIEQVIRRLTATQVDAVHVSFDVDALDPLIMPGTGTPERGGFTYREASRILRMLRDSDLPIRSIDWVELNPDLDPTGQSCDVAADLLGVALGEDVFRPR
jgi:arginase